MTFEPVPRPSIVDPTTGWILEVPLRSPLTLMQISVAIGPPPSTSSFMATAARQGSHPWLDATFDSVRTDATFDRVAFELPFVGDGEPLSAADIATMSTWVDGRLTVLHGSTPIPSSKPLAAMARGEQIVAAVKSIENSGDFAVTISRPDHKPIPLRLAWDAMYSTGYEWTGDDMQWMPSEDVEGLHAFTSTESGTWTPEDAANPNATTDNIRIRYNMLVNPQPDRMLDVMLGQSRYIATRVGGQIVDTETDKPLDERLFRQRVNAQVKLLTNAGIAPGSPVALTALY